MGKNNFFQRFLTWRDPISPSNLQYRVGAPKSPKGGAPPKHRTFAKRQCQCLNQEQGKVKKGGTWDVALDAVRRVGSGMPRQIGNIQRIVPVEVMKTNHKQYRSHIYISRSY